ncbi:MAG: hypothetical protein N4A70_00635 [Pelagimonas sp.]|jgi:uncharacterized membrane protein YozB (DUF420 family)|nr:hypothetical protein [Pelagimonas sp.]
MRGYEQDTLTRVQTWGSWTILWITRIILGLICFAAAFTILSEISTLRAISFASRKLVLATAIFLFVLIAVDALRRQAAWSLWPVLLVAALTLPNLILALWASSINPSSALASAALYEQEASMVLITLIGVVLTPSALILYLRKMRALV